MKHLKKKPIYIPSKQIRQTPLYLAISLSLLFSTDHIPLSAATIAVTSTDDSGTGTLRAAISAALPGDNIDCSVIAGGTITLASPLPPISSSIVINNVGTGIVTINEAASFAALTITGGTPTTIQNIVITNPFNPTDTTVTPTTTDFTVISSQLANLDTTGSTTLTASSLNGTVIVEPGGELNLTSTSTLTATTPVTINVGGQLNSTGSTITGSINSNGTLVIDTTPVSGTITLLGPGTLSASGAGTVIGALAANGTAAASLTTSADVSGASTVAATATLTVDGAGTTLNTLDTFGTTTLTNGAATTGAATVEVGGTLNASGVGTTLASLTSSGTSTLSTSASVTGALSVLAGTTTLNTAAKVLGASTVSAGANLSVSGIGTTLNTLDTFGITTLTSGATAAATTVEVGGTLNASGAGTTISSLLNAGTSNLSASASVTGALSVIAGTTNLSTAAKILGTSTVLAGANLNVDGTGTTLNTLDTFGTTTLTNDATITGLATVEPGAALNATNAFLNSLVDNGTATLLNTPVTNNVTVGTTGTLTASGTLTTLGSLTSSGTSNLSNNVSVLGNLLVQNGLTSLQTGASVISNTTVAAGANLSVNASSLNTLDTFGTTTLSNGATVASAMIEPGGLLTGVGNIVGSTINQGTFKPGFNGVGTLSSDSYTQQPNGAFESVITSTSAGLSSSVTTAQLAGDLFVDVLTTAPYVAPVTYTIIQAANVNGTFSSIDLSTPSLFQITYFPNRVDIQLFPVFAMGLSGNALSAADCFLSSTSITPSIPPTDQEVVTQALFGLQANEFQFAFNQMQPAQYSALTFVQLTNALSLQRSIFRHSALWKKRQNFGGCPYALPLPKSEGCSDCPENLCTLGRSPCCLTPSAWHGWLDVTGVWQQQTPTDQQYGFHDTSGLLSFGIDGTFDNISVGLLGAYQVDSLTWGSNAGDATTRTGYGGFYAMIEGNHYLVDISALIGYSRYRANRKIRFSSIRRIARGNYDSYEGVAGIGVGSYNTLCGVEWVPYARVDYAYLTQAAFNEAQASSLNLQVRPYNTSLVQTQFGVFFEHTCCLESGLLTPKLDLSYIGQFAVFHKHLRSRFENIPTCTFSSQGWNYGRNLFAPTLSLTFFRAGSQLSFELGYTGQFGHRYWNQQGYASLDWKF